MNGVNSWVFWNLEIRKSVEASQIVVNCHQHFHAAHQDLLGVAAHRVALDDSAGRDIVAVVSIGIFGGKSAREVYLAFQMAEFIKPAQTVLGRKR